MPYSKVKIWIIIGIAATLILGFIIGSLTARIISQQHYKRWITHKRQVIEKIAKKGLLAKLSSELNLTRPQIQAIGGILRIQSIKITQLHKKYKYKLNFIIEQSQKNVRSHLLPKQQVKFDQFILKHRRTWQRISHSHAQKQ